MNPYNKLDPSKFWKLEVANKHFTEIDLASHRFDFKKFNKIAAYGSCFAQRFITFLRLSINIELNLSSNLKYVLKILQLLLKDS